MKTAWLILLLLASSLALVSSDQQEPVIVGHGDGEITLSIPICVVDTSTGSPLSGVEVVFFSRLERYQLREIELIRRAGKVPLEPPPSGTSAVTGYDGRLSISCRFFAAFPIAYLSGRKVEVPAQVYPDGAFVISRTGYQVLEIESSRLFNEAPYEPEELKREKRVQLRKAAQPGATDNPDDAQRLREDH
jgi:hypothetical protein